MKLTIFSCILVYIFTPLFAQLVVQSGRTREISYDKRSLFMPLSDVRVKIETEERSNEQGVVKLVISNNNDATFCFRSIKKPGYILINPSEKELITKKFPLNKNTIIEVSLANADKIKVIQESIMLKAMNSYFERIKDLSNSINKEHNEDLKQALRRELHILRTGRSDMMNLIRKKANELAKADYYSLSSEEIRILDLKKEGKYNELITAILSNLSPNHIQETHILAQMIYKGEQQLAADKAVRDRRVIDYRNLADAYMLKFEARKASKYLKLIIDLYPSDPDNYFYYSEFVRTNLRDYDEALKICIEGLQIAEKKHTKDHQLLAAFYNTLGLIYYETRKYSKSETFFHKSLSTYDQVAQLHPEIYTIEIVKVLNNISRLYFSTYQFDKAKKGYERSLNTLNKLVKNDPDSHQPILAIVLMNLGALYHSTNEIIQSEQCYKRSLGIYETLSKNNHTYDHHIGMVLNSLGLLYRQVNHFTNAQECYLLSIKIYTKLSRQNPDAHEPELASIYHNIGALYASTGQFVKSQDYYLRCLRLREEHAKQDPQTYEAELAKILLNLSNLYSSVERLSEAQKYYLRSLNLFEKLARDEPEAFEPYLGIIYYNLGIQYTKSNKYKLAKKSWKRSLYIFRKLEAKNKGLYIENIKRLTYWINNSPN